MMAAIWQRLCCGPHEVAENGRDNRGEERETTGREGWLDGVFESEEEASRPLGFHGESFEQLWCGGRHFHPVQQ